MTRPLAQQMDREDMVAGIILSMWAVSIGCLGVWAVLHLPPPETLSDALLRVSIGLGAVGFVIGFGYAAYTSWRMGL